SLETIMRQKYVAMFWVGIESWADYRRTGYPILKTNGPAAENRGILPTRLRYPATEAFQNAKWHEEALNDWLGGENNMQTDVWWASTEESKALRRLGRQ
ncbi:MAG: SusD/RagB family nutrient-binding outer membrane lipoprotein, partial [Alistipes sp.]|nr:SusD/RagB family nutrient-binding outer membrane lipoprotein [Alistipes sp.]